MPNVTSVTTQVNNTPSFNGQLEPITLKIPRKRIPYDDYVSLKTQQKKIVEKLIDERKIKGAEEALLEYYVHNCDKDGVTECSQSIAAEKIGRYTRESLSRANTRLTKKGIITSDKRGWQQTNCTTILCLVEQPELINNCDVSSHKSNNLSSLRDLTNNITHDEYVSLSANTDSKTVTKHKPSKHISLAKLNGSDPDGEVIRVCLAWMLTEEQTKRAVLKMRNRTGMTNPAKYLAGIMRNMSTEEIQEPEKPKLTFEQREAIEAPLREKAEVMAKVALAQKGIVQAEVYDPFDPWHSHYSTEVINQFNKLRKELIH